MKKIKEIGVNAKNVISSPDRIEVKKYNYPIFCFKHLHKDFGLHKCTSDERKCLIEQIVHISQLDWNAIQHSPRHGAGSEKISIQFLRCNLPESIKATEDVKHLLAFRFDGKKAFVGFRNQFIFHILFIDRDFTLYDH